VVYEGGRFTRVDRDAALRELHDSLQHALAEDEIEREPKFLQMASENNRRSRAKTRIENISGGPCCAPSSPCAGIGLVREPPAPESAQYDFSHGLLDF
jgi:hypothetical protein